MKRSKLVLSAKWCSFIHCPWKLFRKHLHLRWSCVGCPAKSGNPGSSALRDLMITDSITVAGPLQRDGPQTDVAGSVRTEQTHKAVTASLGGTEMSGPRGHHTGGGPTLVPTSLRGSAFRWCWAGSLSLSLQSPQTEARKPCLAQSNSWRPPRNFHRKLRTIWLEPRTHLLNTELV